jgi:hypothetical protein
MNLYLLSRNLNDRNLGRLGMLLQDHVCGDKFMRDHARGSLVMAAEKEGDNQNGDLVKVQHDESAGRYHVTLPVDWVRENGITEGEQLYVGDSDSEESTGILERVSNLF